MQLCLHNNGNTRNSKMRNMIGFASYTRMWCSSSKLGGMVSRNEEHTGTHCVADHRLQKLSGSAVCQRHLAPCPFPHLHPVPSLLLI